MATLPDSPHPLLKLPILYIADPPPRLKWKQVQAAFSVCGTVSSGARHPVPGSPNRKEWTIRFANLFEAEMALATLQGAVVPDVEPPFRLVLSHSPNLQTAFPPLRLYNQYVKINGLPGAIMESANCQKIFKWFRPAGPLVSVRMNVNVGYQQPAIVIEYWRSEYANVARVQKNALHEEMQGLPAFTLRTFDPSNLYCAGLGAAFSYKDFIDTFSKFGKIKDASLKRIGVPDSFGFVAFWTREAAAQALEGMNKQVIGTGTRAITVRYYEPAAQNVFQPTFVSSAPFPDPQPEPYVNEPKTEPSPESAGEPGPEQQRKEAAARAQKAAEEREAKAAVERELKEAAERKAKEAAAREAAEAKLKQKNARQEERRARKEAAMRAESMAKKNFEEAVVDEMNAKDVLMIAQEVLHMADTELQDATQACAEAKRIFMEAMDRQTKAERQMDEAREDVGNAKGRVQQAEVGRKIAEQEQISFQAAREAIEKEEAEEDEIDEETLRLAELAESIRRMEELRKMEQQEKEERERKKREAEMAEQERLKREQEAREREEAARIAREKEAAERAERERREREEKEKRDAENRVRLYQQAVEMERSRCRQRDTQFCPTWNVNIWFSSHALKRFVAVSAEFDTLKYNESQPLTFESIPWPVLHHPYNMTLELIEWTFVEQFFTSVKDTMKQAEYRALLEKARLRFHPDRWKSRGILRSVLDEDLRSQLEVAGNVVSQAINSLRSRE